jgi:hypothetical protein
MSNPVRRTINNLQLSLPLTDSAILSSEPIIQKNQKEELEQIS